MIPNCAYWFSSFVQNDIQLAGLGSQACDIRKHLLNFPDSFVEGLFFLLKKSLQLQVIPGSV